MGLAEPGADLVVVDLEASGAAEAAAADAASPASAAAEAAAAFDKGDGEVRKTQAQLKRGERLVELLKQDQYVPMAIEEQVVAVFSGVRGFLDRIDTADVTKFERAWVNHMKNNHNDVLATIKSSGEIDDALDAKLTTLCEEFTSAYSS